MFFTWCKPSCSIYLINEVSSLVSGGVYSLGESRFHHFFIFLWRGNEIFHFSNHYYPRLNYLNKPENTLNFFFASKNIHSKFGRIYPTQPPSPKKSQKFEKLFKSVELLIGPYTRKNFHRMFGKGGRPCDRTIKLVRCTFNAE